MYRYWRYWRYWLAVLFMSVITHEAAAQPATRVMSGYAAISGAHAVLWVAREAGFFDKNGLRADVAYIRSG